MTDSGSLTVGERLERMELKMDVIMRVLPRYAIVERIVFGAVGIAGVGLIVAIIGQVIK